MMSLKALTTNPTGRAFWRSLGFREYSVRYEYVQGPEE